ncbi:MAG: hypothetical protein ACE5GU_09055 [Candidatus Scalinduaceae bacterium]
MNNIEEKIEALPLIQQSMLDSYKKRLEWIRTTITILTPSLVLLIGFQHKPHSSEKLLSALLLISILLMTVSILSGLYLLLAEAQAYKKMAEDIKSLVDKGGSVQDTPISLEFSLFQEVLLKVFPILLSLSILFLGSFGICKYL